MATDQDDTGREHRADDAGGPGSGSRRRGGHPAAACGKCLSAYRLAVLAELGRVSPEPVLRGQEGTGQRVFGNVVEVVSGFDHGI